MKAIVRMADGIIDLSCFLSERIKLDEFETGIEHVRTHPAGFVKAAFVHEYRSARH